jgi:hypothetical protein
MEPKDFIVVEIEGEYAYLREVGAAPGNERLKKKERGLSPLSVKSHLILQLKCLF